eukprot:1145769-Pelagomonas_calceolata.AAC.4
MFLRQQAPCPCAEGVNGCVESRQCPSHTSISDAPVAASTILLCSSFCERVSGGTMSTGVKVFSSMKHAGACSEPVFLYLPIGQQQHLLSCALMHAGACGPP